MNHTEINHRYIGLFYNFCDLDVTNSPLLFLPKSICCLPSSLFPSSKLPNSIDLSTKLKMLSKVSNEKLLGAGTLSYSYLYRSLSETVISNRPLKGNEQMIQGLLVAVGRADGIKWTYRVNTRIGMNSERVGVRKQRRTNRPPQKSDIGKQRYSCSGVEGVGVGAGTSYHKEKESAVQAEDPGMIWGPRAGLSSSLAVRGRQNHIRQKYFASERLHPSIWHRGRKGVSITPG